MLMSLSFPSWLFALSPYWLLNEPVWMINLFSMPLAGLFLCSLTTRNCGRYCKTLASLFLVRNVSAMIDTHYTHKYSTWTRTDVTLLLPFFSRNSLPTPGKTSLTSFNTSSFSFRIFKFCFVILNTKFLSFFNCFLTYVRLYLIL